MNSAAVNIGYKIKLVIAVERRSTFWHKNEFMVPTVYSNIDQAKEHICHDIDHRLQESMFFRSQKIGFDLVKYTQEASVNTYLGYRIIPIKLSEYLHMERLEKKEKEQFSGDSF